METATNISHSSPLFWIIQDSTCKYKKSYLIRFTNNLNSGGHTRSSHYFWYNQSTHLNNNIRKYSQHSALRVLILHHWSARWWGRCLEHCPSCPPSSRPGQGTLCVNEFSWITSHNYYVSYSLRIENKILWSKYVICSAISKALNVPIFSLDGF